MTGHSHCSPALLDGSAHTHCSFKNLSLTTSTDLQAIVHCALALLIFAANLKPPSMLFIQMNDLSFAWPIHLAERKSALLRIRLIMVVQVQCSSIVLIDTHH